ASMQPILNKQTGHVEYLSISSENCIQIITDAIITNIRYKVPKEEIALLCCCLPSLIRQIMCKSPWLTPNDIIQWLSSDIIKEAMGYFDKNDFEDENTSRKVKQSHTNKDRFFRKEKDKKVNDNISMKSRQDDNDSLSSYRSRISETSQHSILSKHSSQSIFNLPSNIHKKQKKYINKKRWKNPGKNKTKSRKQSTNSLINQQTNEWKSNSNLSTDSFDSKENLDKKIIQSNDKSKRDNRLSPHQIEYPVKKDSNASKDLEKCLAFYHKVQEYFDDDIAAMLLKCCLCYGHCSDNK
ncbi:unnamed protein product, partial [Rotaria sp. Silwood2]